MSRVGKKVINVPSDVNIDLKDNFVVVKGKKGSLEKQFEKSLEIKIENNVLTVERKNDEQKMRELHGTTRALLFNMVEGVSKGFSKNLELVGVGYRAAIKGKGLTLSLGYSHPIEILPIEGITFKVEGTNKITIEGIDKELVGEIAAKIRLKRPPEPYKGKGVKYSGEIIRRKEGKKS